MMTLRHYLFWAVILIHLASCNKGAADLIYVATIGNDGAKGTQDSPLETIGKAIELSKEHQFHEIVIAEGTYYLDSTLTFAQFKGDSIAIRGRGKVVVFGGKRIRGFTHLGNNLNVADISHLLEGKFNLIRQLFKNGQSLPRAKTPNEGYYYTQGPIEECKKWIGYWDWEMLRKARVDKPLLFTSFKYRKNDIKKNWAETPFVEVKELNSWETSWHTMRKIDTTRKEIYFNTPTIWPIGFFGKEIGDRLRYQLYNHIDFIDQPGKWMVNPEEGKLYYLTDEGEDVESNIFVVPTLKRLINVENAKNLTIENITFSHTDYPMGFVRFSLNLPDGSKALSWVDKAKKTIDPEFPEEFYPGYAESQGAINSGESIVIEDSKNILFKNCNFYNLSTYALHISQGASFIHIDDCRFDGLGAGGIKLGIEIRDISKWKHPISKAPHNNSITNSTFSNGGSIHTGSVAIWIAQAYDNLIENNHIFNFPYSGISLGWSWLMEPNCTERNNLSRNKIHDVLQVLTDGGGIYTVGPVKDCLIEANEIYNIVRPHDASGSRANGIHCDKNTEGLSIINNYIHDIMQAPIRFNNTNHKRMKTVLGNYFDVDYLPVIHNNDYNMHSDENGFIHLVIEGNYFGVKNAAEWYKKYRQ